MKKRLRKIILGIHAISFFVLGMLIVITLYNHLELGDNGETAQNLLNLAITDDEVKKGIILVSGINVLLWSINFMYLGGRQKLLKKSNEGKGE